MGEHIVPLLCPRMQEVNFPGELCPPFPNRTDWDTLITRVKEFRAQSLYKRTSLLPTYLLRQTLSLFRLLAKEHSNLSFSVLSILHKFIVCQKSIKSCLLQSFLWASFMISRLHVLTGFSPVNLILCQCFFYSRGHKDSCRVTGKLPSPKVPCTLDPLWSPCPENYSLSLNHSLREKHQTSQNWGAFHKLSDQDSTQLSKSSENKDSLGNYQCQEPTENMTSSFIVVPGRNLRRILGKN